MLACGAGFRVQRGCFQQIHVVFNIGGGGVWLVGSILLLESGRAAAPECAVKRPEVLKWHGSFSSMVLLWRGVLVGRCVSRLGSFGFGGAGEKRGCRRREELVVSESCLSDGVA
jgi:hypothetical protein